NRCGVRYDSSATDRGARGRRRRLLHQSDRSARHAGGPPRHPDDIRLSRTGNRWRAHVLRCGPSNTQRNTRHVYPADSLGREEFSKHLVFDSKLIPTKDLIGLMAFGVTHLWKLKSYATSRDPFGFTQLQLSRLLV